MLFATLNLLGGERQDTNLLFKYFFIFSLSNKSRIRLSHPMKVMPALNSQKIWILLAWIFLTQSQAELIAQHRNIPLLLV